MKIAFVVGQFPSPSETFILDQITGLIERGCQVDIFADVPRGSPVVHADVTRYRLGERMRYAHAWPDALFARFARGAALAATGFLRAPRTVLRAMNTSRYGREATSLRLLYAAFPLLGERLCYDAIHCHFGPYGVRGMFLRDAGILNGKLFTTFHGADLTSTLRAWGPAAAYDKLFAAGDRFLPISERWRKRLVELGCPPEKIIVHRMGIRCSEFPMRARFLAKGERVRCVSVCRLVEKKGLEYAVQAIARLDHADGVRYDIIGDGPNMGALERLVDACGAGERVRLHGWMERKQVLRMLDDAHILIAPSVTAHNGDQEGIPVAIMEAMALGMPILSTRHSGIPELVEDGVAGLLVPEKDVHALQDALQRLLARRHQWPAMGEAGRRAVEREFDVDRLNDRLVELYRNVAQSGTNVAAAGSVRHFKVTG